MHGGNGSPWKAPRGASCSPISRYLATDRGRRRTVFLVLIASQQSTVPSELRLEDVDLPLPCHEDIWNARNAVEWLQKMAARRSCPPKLSEALFGLRTDGSDAEWMGTFACTVLTAAVGAAVRAGWSLGGVVSDPEVMAAPLSSVIVE